MKGGTKRRYTSRVCTDDRRKTSAEDSKSGKPSDLQLWHSPLFAAFFEVSKSAVVKHRESIAKKVAKLI